MNIEDRFICGSDMSKKLIFLQLLVLLAIYGCSHIPFLGGLPANHVKDTELSDQKESNSFVAKGQIVDDGLLKQGTNIIIIPFKAGVNVAASEELDKIALMIVKGCAEGFQDDPNRRFNILTDENSGNADFVIQGHISELKGPSKVRRWILLKGQKMLGVNGKMIDVRSEEAVAIFEDQVETKNDDYRNLGYRTGKNIAGFILSEAE